MYNKVIYQKINDPLQADEGDMEALAYGRDIQGLFDGLKLD